MAFIKAVGGIILIERKLLLIRRKHNPNALRWSLPGGKLKPGETYKRALIRELKEELNLNMCKAGKFIGARKLYFPDESYYVRNYMVLAPPDALNQIKAGSDALAIELFTINDLNEITCAPSVIEFVLANKEKIFGAGI